MTSVVLDPGNIRNLEELFAIAYRIEADAVDRYVALAEQMEVHNNSELTNMFRELARVEGLHAAEIREQAGDIDVVELAKLPLRWPGSEGPEEVDFHDLHYMMTPWHALQLALKAESRALDFYRSIVASTSDARIKAMAEEFAEEEVEHVNICHRLLRKYPEPAEGWHEDPDDPVSQE